MLKPSAKAGVVTYPLKLNSLIALPQDYSELINSISGFTCPKVIVKRAIFIIDRLLFYSSGIRN